jgi:hypothetical protein
MFSDRLTFNRPKPFPLAISDGLPHCLMWFGPHQSCATSAPKHDRSGRRPI